MLYTISSFAKAYDRSRQTIQNHIKKDLLVLDQYGKIDPDHPKNDRWIKYNCGGIDIDLIQPIIEPNKKVKKQPKPKKTKTKTDPLMDEIPALRIKKAKLDLAFRGEQIKSSRQRRAVEQEVLIPRDMVAKVFTRLSTTLKNQLITMPSRATPKIVALVKSGSPDQEVQSVLDQEVSKTIDTVKDVLKEYVREVCNDR